MLWISAPLTTFSWVLEGSQCSFFIIDILGKVVDSCEQLQQALDTDTHNSNAVVFCL